MFRHPSRLAWLPLAGALVVLAGCGSSSAKSNPTATVSALQPQPTQPVPATAVISGGDTAAIVNGHHVPMSAYRLLFNFTQRQFASSTTVTAAQIAGHTMDQVIAQEITKEYAGKHGISVSQAELNGIIQQQQTRSGGPAAFQTALSRYGLTIPSFEQLVGPSLLEQKVAQKVAPIKPQVVPVAKVRHILIGTTLQGKKIRSDAAAKARAHQILNQLLHGGNFSTLAQKYSDDPGKAANGGYYTVHPTDQLVPQFLQAAFAMHIQKPGIIKTVYGYHVFEVMSRGKGPAPATQAQQVQQQNFTKWVHGQEAHAKIQRIAKVQTAKK
ncbi:MAG: peptidylprolyl isomerase [Chloroflexota bacterium]